MSVERHKKKIAYFFGKFPWYPFTFICNEMMALKRGGFDVVILVLNRGEKRELHGDFEELWDDIVVVDTDYGRGLRDFHYFEDFYPFRVARLRKRFMPHAADEGDIFKDPYLLPAFSAARHILGRGDVDHIHSHFSYRDSTIAYMITQLLNIPYGFTTHADAFVAAKYKLLREQIEDSAVVFADTRQAKEKILEVSKDNCAAGKVVLKPGGINLEKFSFLERIRERKNLIAICRFELKKGLIYLVRAAHILIKKGYAVNCVIVGSANNPAEQKNLEEVLDYIGGNRLEKFFKLTGFLTQEEYISYMKESACFIAPYIVTDRGARDGVPTSIIEAMAMGLVPVTTDAGAITELVEDMENGLVVAQKEPAALAGAIELLINDGALFERLRKNARRKVEEERDVEKNEKIIVEHLDTLFHKQQWIEQGGVNS